MTATVATADNSGVRIITYNSNDGLLDEDVNCAIQDSIGYLWFATHDGLVRYDGSRFVTYKAEVGDDCPLTSNRIEFIGEDENHDIQCFSADQYFRFRRATGKFELAEGPISDTRHFSDNDKRILGFIKQLDEYRGIDIKVRVVDHQGGIWIKSNRGLERVVHDKPKVIPQKYTQAQEEVTRGFMYDRQQRLWVSDMNKYVRVIIGNDNSPLYLGINGTLSTTPVRFGHNIYSMFEDSKGRIWLGAKPGVLFVLTPKKNGYSIVSYTSDSNNDYSFSGTGVYRILEDSRHRIWIATYGKGLQLVRENADGTMDFINKDNEMKTHPQDALRIHGMAITKDDVILLATTKGFYTVDARQQPYEMMFHRNVRRVNDGNSIGSNEVMDVVCTEDGSVFLATKGGGISKTTADNLLSDSLKFQSFTSLDGLATDLFQTLVIDNDRRLWAIGKKALCEISLSGDSIVNYQNMLSEQDMIFAEVPPVILSDSSMVIGTNKGFLRIGRANISKSAYVPKILFDTPEHITLEPDTGNVRIEFSALDFNRNEPILYRYMLEGVDTEWHYTKENHIDYTNFPIGEYTLRVSSTNSDGVWVDNERHITILRPSTFHEAWYSWLLYGVLLSLLIIGSVRTFRYVRRLQHKMGEYRRATDEKISTLDSKIKELISANSNITTVDEEDKEDSGALFAERAKNFAISEIANTEITVEDFARHMNMSASLLYVKCRKYLGYTPSKYMQEVRIKYAAKLILANPDASISDISYRCGFADPKYFSRCFKSTMGCSPKDYNKEQNKE